MNIKEYWKSIFITNWQTTSVGLTACISTAVGYIWAWTHPAPGVAPGMPNPEGYIVPFLTGLFLVFRAVDPKNEKPPAP